ncbi:DUF4011 domain-containing protein [Actinomyces sp.]|uniref:DUF4011 domain-containing protein n=1 Tax=Actinomyces sp. TaxID=29317 RepID=UPI0026DDAFD7|nr:DUF4011 domain-containing protein [Actinomyces sp.]MDO4901405.1 DUF4011 domain-containing protein [Actinomyces sp.]
MNLDNHDLVLRGLFSVLPLHLEPYLRNTLGDRCEPETLRALLAGSGPVSELPDLADLSTQIRILTARGADGRYLLPLPRGAGSKLHEVRRFRNEAVHGARFDADKTLAALVAVSELLRLIGAETGRVQVRELIGAINDGRGVRRDPFDAVAVGVECVPVIGYSHAVAGLSPEVSVTMSLAGSAAGAPERPAAQGQDRLLLTDSADGAPASGGGSLGPVDVSLTIIEDDGGRELVEPWRFTWDTVRELRIASALKLNRTSLAQIDQSGGAHVRLEMRDHTGVTAVRRIDGLIALSPRQWQQAGGNRWAGLALATFVQPDQPVLRAVAAEVCSRSRHGAAASGPDGMVEAACAVLRRRGLEALADNGWRQRPQTIYSAAELFDARAAAPLSAAILLAGALERLGVDSLLAFTPNAVLLGYPRNGFARLDVSPAALAALVRHGEIGLVDPSMALRSPAAVLHALDAHARDMVLESLSELTLVVPVGAARSEGALPQPALERGEDDVVVERTLTPVQADQEQDLEPPAAAEPMQRPETPPARRGVAPELTAAGASDAAPPRVEEWKRALLDLSLRNPLIDRTPRSAIELKVPPELVGDFEDMVNRREYIALRPSAGGRGGPGRGSSPTGPGAPSLLNEHAVEVVTGSTEYTRRLQALAAAARTTLEETGANNLYLTIGTLTWYTDGRRVRSPLILVPVKLEREGDTFGLLLDEAGASTPNFSLLARFQADTGIELTALSEPIHDGHGVNVEATLDNLRQQLRAAGRRDRVEPTVHIGLFRFSTYRMWRDLAEDWPTITGNPLVARLLEDAPGTAGAETEGRTTETTLDLDEVVEQLPLEADSAQAQVIADAVAGRSLVVEGPPGTGKSQTVANLIFRSLAQGRTVMFVAEKLSALDVVARRLREETGIGDLLLNLHDNGMRPTQVREALRRALELQAPGHDTADTAGLRQQLAQVRGELNAYRERLHAPGREGKSYYAARQELVEATDADAPAASRAQALFDARAARTGLDGFDADRHDARLDEYRRLQGRLREQLAPELLDAVLTRRDRVLREAGPRAEALRRELERRKGTMNVRDLVDSYWDLITAITPCILVSPDSAARFFPAHRRYVDVVVFDEASQITVADAVGALGRGRSAVVVGDPKQMPPTPAPGTAAAAGESGAGSILDRCLALGLPARRLTWHYRSRVESLIAFSNRRYYGGSLLSFPSPLTITAPDDGPDGHGISLRRVNGTYYRAETAKHRGIRPNTNPVEANRIVEEVERRFAASPQATPSLGIITFNARQCELIETMLRKSGQERIITALDARDGLFVRNLDNVQGEERDTILISVTFSANERGDLPLNFGTLGHAGGERRLNVAITRARRQVIVFSSFDPEDLHAERSTHQGLKDLRDYLVRARSGAAPRALPLTHSVVDLHRNQIAERLRDAGVEVTAGVGHSAFEIDLVLTGAGGSHVAVLLDGPGWNRRASMTDRDLLPVDVLRSMGWERVERVWMPAWVADADGVVARLLAAVGGAPKPTNAPAPEPAAPTHPQPTTAEPEMAPASAPVPPEAAPEETRAAALDEAATDAAVQRTAAAAPLGPREYRQWRPVGVYPLEVLDRAQDMDSPEHAQVVDTARAICDVEAPLTRHRLIVKLCRVYGLTRVVSSREQKVDELLGDAFAYTDAAGFVWRNQDAARSPVQYRRNALDHVDSIKEIHPRELVALMRAVRADTPAWASPEELCTRALRRLSAKKRKLSARGVKEALTNALAEVEQEDGQQ